jgi:mRNA interferase MazF
MGRGDLVTVLLITSSRVDAPMLRVTVELGRTSGLERTTQVMIDRSMTVRRNKLGQVVGSLESDVMVEVERRLNATLRPARAPVDRRA